MFKLCIVILLFVSVNLFAQKKQIPPPPIPMKNAKNGSGLNPNYRPIPLDKRLKKFPFKNAVTIEIISFNLEADAETMDLVLTTTDTTIQNDSNRESSGFVKLSTIVAQRNYENVNQRKKLTLNEIDNLTDILYNTCSKYSINRYYKSGCYNPRNGILFYNAAAEIYEYLEICFECNQMQAEPKVMPELENFCSAAYTELKTFFSKHGIETEKRIKK